MHANGGILGSASDDILVGVLGPGPDLSEERGGDSEQGREEPDHRDVDGVRPWSWNILALSPLGILHKEMIGQEQDGQGEEEQEAVVEISENIQLSLFVLTKDSFDIQIAFSTLLSSTDAS